MTTDNIGYELVKEQAVLAQGRTPVLAPQGWEYAAPGSKPTATNEGVDVDGAIVGLVGVRLRKSADLHRSWYRVVTNEAGKSYGINFGDGAQTVAAAADAETTITDLKSALEGNATFVNLGGTAAVVSGHTDTLEVAFPDRTYAVAAGTGDGSLLQEAGRCAWQLWGLPLGVDQWALLRGEPARLSKQAQELARVQLAGWRRVKVEVLDADGAVLPLVGPGRRDDRADLLLEDSATELETADDDRYSFPDDSDGGLTFGDQLGARDDATIKRLLER